MAGPIVLAAGAAGAGLIGGVIGNRNRGKEAEKDRSFQKYMSNTAWQRGIRDMELAGINPALAYSQGGASSPSGAMAQQSDVISPAVGSAQQAARLEKELKLLQTQEVKAYEDAKLAKTMSGESAARTELTYRNQKSVELSNEMARLQMFSARNVADVAKTTFGKRATFADRVRQMIFGGGAAFQPIRTGR